MFWILLGLFLLQPTSSCAGLIEAATWLSPIWRVQQGQMPLWPVLCRRSQMRWHSSSACPASSFPLCHVPLLLSSPPLTLGYIVQCHRWLLSEPTQATNPAEKEPIRIKQKGTIFSAIPSSVGSTAQVEKSNEGMAWFTLCSCLSLCCVKWQPEHRHCPLT